MKPTTMLAWHNDAFVINSQTCGFEAHNQLRCSKTCVRHERPEGFDKDGNAKTSHASAYPPQLCEFWAHLIVNPQRVPSHAVATLETPMCSPCGLNGEEIPPEHYIDHMPEHPNCPTCREAKMQKKAHYKTKEADKDPFKEPHTALATTWPWITQTYSIRDRHPATKTKHCAS